MGQETKLTPLLPKTERLQDLETDPHFVHRVAGEGDPQGIADAFGQEDAEPDRRLDRAGKGGARLGDADMERVVDLSAKGAGRPPRSSSRPRP